VFVLDDKDHVEAGQDGGLKVNVLARGLQVIVPAEDGVGGGEDRSPRVQHGGDARLGNGDGLLLHGLVNGHPVVLSHLVKLVNTHHSTIGKHHRASLQIKISLQKKKEQTKKQQKRTTDRQNKNALATRASEGRE